LHSGWDGGSQVQAILVKQQQRHNHIVFCMVYQLRRSFIKMDEKKQAQLLQSAEAL
jgi:hypothetical protein